VSADSPLVFLNGRILPQLEASVPITDRGLLYGDGLFETIRVVRGQPRHWDRHWARLARGAAFLKLRLPDPPETLLDAARRLAELNALPDSVLRLTLTRGSGPRGYSPRGADQPTLLMTLHPAGPPVTTARVIASSFRVAANDPLSAFKTCSKLVQVMARAEADEQGADEALLVNTHGHLAEATASNIFWVQDGIICTPPLQDGALDGITRGRVLEACRKLGLPAREATAGPEILPAASGVFLTRSTANVVDVIELDGRPLPVSPLTGPLRTACENG